jgi:hypothetical protein
VGDADCTVKREVRISLFFAPGAIFFWLLFVDDDPGQMKLWMRKSVRKTVSIYMCSGNAGEEQDQED